MIVRWPALLCCLWFWPCLAGTFVVEGESLADPAAPRGTAGAPPGWSVVPLPHGDASSAAALVAAPPPDPNTPSDAAARVAVPPGTYRIWARLGCGAAPTEGGVVLTLGDADWRLTPPVPTAGEPHYGWVALDSPGVTLSEPVEVRLRATGPAALDLLVFSDEPGFDPRTLPLPRWPRAGGAVGVSARLWRPALLDEPADRVAGLTWPVLLAVTSRLDHPATGVRIVLELPPGLRLLDPTGRVAVAGAGLFGPTAASPQAFERRPLPTGGSQAVLDLAGFPAGLDGMVDPAGCVALLLDVAPDAPATGTVRIGCLAEGQDEVWWTSEVRVRPLPELGERPRRAPWMLSLPGLAACTPEEQVALLQSVHRLGYQRVNLPEALQQTDPAADRSFSRRYVALAEAARQAGLSPVLGLAPWLPWTPDSPYSDRYLAAHPNAAAVLAPSARAAQAGRKMLSPTALLEDAQDYLDERLTALAELARRAGLREVWWQDSENRPLELSFDPATLDLFRRVAGLEQPGLGPVAPLSPARILAEPALRQRWSGFRSEQNTALTALLYRRLKALIPGLRWWVRGGYQGPDAVTEWGLDWRLRAPHLDGIFAGPGPDGAEAVDAALATWQAVRHVAAVPVSGAVGAVGLPGAARWHDSALTGARRVLGAAAGAVGLDNGNSFLTMDGGHLTGLAAAAGFVAAHEPLLLTGQRQLYDTNHDGLVDVVVVRHTSSVLTVAANQTAWPVTVLPRCGQAGDLPAELTLAPGTWQTWRTDAAPLVPDGHR